MRQWNITLPPRRREFGIDLPGRVREAKLWIHELTFRERVKAVGALVAGAVVTVILKKSAQGKDTVRVGGRAEAGKNMAVHIRSSAAVNGRTVGPTLKVDIRSHARGKVLSDGKLRGGMRLLALKPLREADPMTLREMDDMSLAALYYTVLEEW